MKLLIALLFGLFLSVSPVYAGDILEVGIQKIDGVIEVPFLSVTGDLTVGTTTRVAGTASEGQVQSASTNIASFGGETHYTDLTGTIRAGLHNATYIDTDLTKEVWGFYNYAESTASGQTGNVLGEVLGARNNAAMTGDGTLYKLTGSFNMAEIYGNVAGAATVSNGRSIVGQLLYSSSDYNATMTDYRGLYLYSQKIDVGNTLSGTNWYQMYVSDFVDFGGTTTNKYGLWMENIGTADAPTTNRMGIVLDGNGDGSNIVFGDSQQISISRNSSTGYLDSNGGINVTAPNDKNSITATSVRTDAYTAGAAAHAIEAFVTDQTASSDSAFAVIGATGTITSNNSTSGNAATGIATSIVASGSGGYDEMIGIKSINRMNSSGNYAIAAIEGHKANVWMGPGVGVNTINEISFFKSVWQNSEGHVSTISDIYGVRLSNPLLTSHAGSTTRQTGIFVEQQTGGVTNRGITLDGNGAGSDIVFGDSQQISVGRNSSSGYLDVKGNGIDVWNNVIRLGSDGAANTRTDATGKTITIAIPHRTNAEEDVSLSVVSETASHTVLNIGGGGTAYNATTKILFKTGATNTTLNGTQRVLIDNNGNFIFGATETIGTGAAGVMSILNGTAPSTSVTDGVQIWSGDINAVAGKASLLMRNEAYAGTQIVPGVIYKTDTGDPAGYEGAFTINTFDNVAKLYAEGAWRTVITTDFAGTGNVGIGTATPTHKLQVIGTTDITGALTSASLTIGGLVTTGGTVTTDGAYTVVTYNGSGSFTPPTGVSVVEALVVGGGAGGDGGVSSAVYGHGGGGGRVVYRSAFSVTPGSPLTVTVGTGGAGGAMDAQAIEGVSSVFGSLTATGGSPANNIGSGGDGGDSAKDIDSVVTSYNGLTDSVWGGAGGAGAGGVGGAVSDTGPNTGGIGYSSSISGASVAYGAGGNGSYNGLAAPSAVAANLGLGGHGHATSYRAGGSGVVIVRFLTPTATPLLQVVGLPSYTNNTTALAGGLTAGAFYQVTGSDPRQVAVVF